MADVFDYLTWRGDVPFSTDPFNEVDALILSELAYTDFENPFPEGACIPIGEVYEAFFQKHTREQILKDFSYTAKAALLMEEMSRGARFKQTKMQNFINEIDKTLVSQISAVTYLLEDGTTFVAFRGTDSSLAGWREDFDLSYLPQTEGQRRAVEYLDMVGRKTDRPLRVGGHSKGGNFAVYASAFSPDFIQDAILEVYSFDGPGFRRETIDSPGYQRILPKVISIIPDTAVIGMLLSSKSTHQVIKSSASGIFQHDGFSWMITRNRFARTSLSDMGRMVEQTIGLWLEQMNDQDRKALSDAVFMILEGTGRDSFHGMNEQKWKSVEAMISSMASLPKEKRQTLLKLTKKLIQSGSQTVVSNFFKRNHESVLPEK